jgi:hypothetical protein
VSGERLGNERVKKTGLFFEYRNAKDQPQKVPTLWVFYDLQVSHHESVGKTHYSAIAETCQVSRLHAPTLPPDFLLSCTKSGKRFVRSKVR